MKKLIITVAHTGNVPTKELNENTPVSVEEIVADIKACAEAGASVAHIHVRDEDGKPTSERRLFEQVLNELDKEKVNIIRQVSQVQEVAKTQLSGEDKCLTYPKRRWQAYQPDPQIFQTESMPILLTWSRFWQKK